MNWRFDWDLAKAHANIRKHRISFETAARVFADPFASSEQDRIEDGEFRWVTIGLVGAVLMLTVAHTIVDEDDGGALIRIISARRASRRERERYEEERSHNL